MNGKMVPVIVLKNKDKENRYLASHMDFGDWEDPDLDVTFEQIECAFMIWREDLSTPDETDIENAKKESEAFKDFMFKKFGDTAFVSFDLVEILKVYEPENIEISFEKFEIAKDLNE